MYKLSRINIIRVLTVVVIFISITVVGLDFALAKGTEGVKDKFDRQASVAYDDRTQVAPESDNITVITTHSNLRDRIIAIAPDGRLMYLNDTWDHYFDVDPVPGTKTTVQYVAVDELTKGECFAETECARNVIERVNLSNGNVTTIYSRIIPQFEGQNDPEWHDVDLIEQNRYLVGGIKSNRVFILNINSEEITYEWDAIDQYPTSSGGPFPYDWTHLNDVEQLPDGRIMVSLRNHDSVVFLDPGNGFQSSWTLGSDGNHDILYEQHNPDYIPAQNGGPAVVVSDSENNRVVEYQRSNNTWEQSWVWSDDQVRWPRDADRLPNGNTLISDTHGNRLLEVDQNGSIVWQVNGQNLRPYEAERLGTGDESTGGSSAVRENLYSRSAKKSIESSSSTQGGGIIQQLRVLAGIPGRVAWGLLPTKLQNGILFVSPPWAGHTSFGYVLIALLTILIWMTAEVNNRYGIRVERR